jgi:hypothetical protein
LYERSSDKGDATPPFWLKERAFGLTQELPAKPIEFFTLVNVDEMGIFAIDLLNDRTEVRRQLNPYQSQPYIDALIDGQLLPIKD